MKYEYEIGLLYSCLVNVFLMRVILWIERYVKFMRSCCVRGFIVYLIEGFRLVLVVVMM